MSIRSEASSPSRGSALLMVLWLTAALSAVGLAVANNVRGETERTETTVDDAKAWFAARGAIQRAALYVLWGRSYQRADGTAQYHASADPSMNLDFPTAQVHVDIIPETSKLNLNGASAEELFRLLGAVGVPETQAADIAAAIIDWRTPPGLLGASPFDAYYLNLSPSFLPRHASFQENEELLLVRGMTSDLYFGASLDKSVPGLRDCLSIYGSGGAVDINTAAMSTLEAVGLAPQDASTIIRSRAGHPVLTGGELADIKQSLGPSGNRLMLGGQTMYTLRATARLKEPGGRLSELRRSVAALVKFDFSGQFGFEIVRWFDR